MSKQIREIQVKANVGDNKPLANLAKQFGILNKNVADSKKSLNLFANAFTTYLGAISVRELTQISDSMQQLRDRINLLKRPGEDANDIMTQLGDAANRTKTSIDGIATTYSRLANATKNLGISTGTMLKLTETLQNTLS